MRSNLDYGLSLSETLKQYEKYFDPLVISTIEIGEKTGNLPKVLTELEASMLEQIEIQSKIRGAMIYPVILMFLAFVMVIFMLTFVLPKITESFKKGNVELPALTKFLMDTSDFIIAHYILLLIFLFGVGSALYVFSKTYTGQYVLSWL
jgi:type II secretory pathway component PulF